MAVEHSGPSKKYSANWAQAFGSGQPSSPVGKKLDAKKAAPKKGKNGGGTPKGRTKKKG